MLKVILHPEPSTEIKSYANCLKIPNHRKSVSTIPLKFLRLIIHPDTVFEFKELNDYLGGVEVINIFKTIDRYMPSVDAIYPILTYRYALTKTFIEIYGTRR